VIDVRIGLAIVSGLAVGALAALSVVHATASAAEAAALGAAAAGAGATGLAGAFWLGDARSREPNGALVVFILFLALGLMLGAGGHGGHG
jgi:hypothetical protein